MLGGGVLADRFGPRRVVIGSDAVRCAVILGTAAALLLTSPSLGLLITVALVFGTVDALFLPAVGALPPRIAGPAQLARLQGLRGLAALVATSPGRRSAGSWSRWAGRPPPSPPPERCSPRRSRCCSPYGSLRCLPTVPRRPRHRPARTGRRAAPHPPPPRTRPDDPGHRHRRTRFRRAAQHRPHPARPAARLGRRRHGLDRRRLRRRRGCGLTADRGTGAAGARRTRPVPGAARRRRARRRPRVRAERALAIAAGVLVGLFAGLGAPSVPHSSRPTAPPPTWAASPRSRRSSPWASPRSAIRSWAWRSTPGALGRSSRSARSVRGGRAGRTLRPGPAPRRTPALKTSSATWRYRAWRPGDG